MTHPRKLNTPPLPKKQCTTVPAQLVSDPRKAAAQMVRAQESFLPEGAELDRVLQDTTVFQSDRYLLLFYMLDQIHMTHGNLWTDKAGRYCVYAVKSEPCQLRPRLLDLACETNLAPADIYTACYYAAATPYTDKPGRAKEYIIYETIKPMRGKHTLMKRLQSLAPDSVTVFMRAMDQGWMYRLKAHLGYTSEPFTEKMPMFQEGKKERHLVDGYLCVPSMCHVVRMALHFTNFYNVGCGIGELGLMYCLNTSYPYQYTRYEIQEHRKTFAQHLLEDYIAGGRVELYGALDSASTHFSTDSFVYCNNIAIDGIQNIIAEHIGERSALLLTKEPPIYTVASLCFCGCGGNTGGGCAEHFIMDHSCSVFRHLCGDYKVIKCFSEGIRQNILFTPVEQDHLYAQVRTFEGDYRETLRVLNGTNDFDPVIFYSGAYLLDTGASGLNVKVYSQKKPASGPPKAVEPAEQSPPSSTVAGEIKSHHNKKLKTNYNVSHDVRLFTNQKDFEASDEYKAMGWAWAKMAGVVGADLSTRDERRLRIYPFSNNAMFSGDPEMRPGIEVAAVFIEITPFRNPRVVGFRTFTRLSKIEVDIRKLTRDTTPDRYEVYKHTVRFNLTTLYDDGLSYATIINKFTRAILTQHFKDTQYIVADLVAANTNYVNRMKTGFCWSYDPDDGFIPYEEKSALFFWKRPFSGTYELRKAMYQRYRFWYLDEENIPFHEGQRRYETCCWKLTDAQIYDLVGSPELA